LTCGAAGAGNTLTYGIPPLTAAIMGVFTACFGGVFRDVLAGEPCIILNPELYVTAAALAAGVFVVLASFGIEPAVAVVIAFTMRFGLPALALVKQLSLPSHNGHSGNEKRLNRRERPQRHVQPQVRVWEQQRCACPE